ncbi:ion channel [Caldalkalibacillus horti]|nr:ion channel [Bacillus horti]
MKLIVYIILLLCIGVMTISFTRLFRFNTEQCPVFSWTHFLLLIWAYLILTVGFSLIYLSLEFLGNPILAFNYSVTPGSISYIGNLIYFSLVTMLTVGYGDITPIGLGKFIASTQALIGYLLPAAFLASGIAKSTQKWSRSG